jgi:hypothetical protein
MLFRASYNVKALAMWRYSVFLLSGAAAEKRHKSSLFILLPGVIRLPKLKLNSEQKLKTYSSSARHIANAFVGRSFLSKG